MRRAAQARFVSKADVRHWPLVGTPGRLPAARSTSSANASAMRCAWCTQWPRRCSAGDVVAVFPEGTTGDGHGLLPFHANLLQAAISTATPVQPVALRFSEPTPCVSEAVEFVGATSLLQSLWHLVVRRRRPRPPDVPAAASSADADRRELAALLRADIAAALGPIARPQPRRCAWFATAAAAFAAASASPR